MKPSVKIVAHMVFLIALLAVSCGSPQTSESETTAVENESVGPENKLIGVWEIIGSTVEFPPDMNLETVVNETHLPGILIYTKKYFSWVDFQGSDSLPELPEEPTDAQVAAVYNQLDAMAGTYEIEHPSIERHLIVSKNPNQIGSDLGSWKSFAFEGDILTMSVTPPSKITVTLKLQRLE
jgi:hypothetical protein